MSQTAGLHSTFLCAENLKMSKKNEKKKERKNVNERKMDDISQQVEVK